MSPRPGLSTARIVDAGLEIVRRDGFAALSMRTVAHELDTSATSLYRHVAHRDELVQEILERIAEGLPIDVDGATPTDRLLTRLLAAHAYMRDHLWVVRLLTEGRDVARAALRFSDACLADLLASGLTPAAALTAYRSLWNLVTGSLLNLPPDRPADAPPTSRQQIIASADLATLPALARVLRDPAPVGDDLPVALTALVAGLVGDR